MLRTAGWLALPRRALSAGFDGGISPPFQFVAAQLLGGWDLTETRLSLASPTRLLWTHTGGPHSGKAYHPLFDSQNPGPHPMGSCDSERGAPKLHGEHGGTRRATEEEGRRRTVRGMTPVSPLFVSSVTLRGFGYPRQRVITSEPRRTADREPKRHF